jgi:hypothetical protein
MLCFIRSKRVRIGRLNMSSAGLCRVVDFGSFLYCIGCGEGGFGYKISSPAGIFTAELTALFVTPWRGYSTLGKVLDFDRQLEFS